MTWNSDERIAFVIGRCVRSRRGSASARPATPDSRASRHLAGHQGRMGTLDGRTPTSLLLPTDLLPAHTRQPPGSISAHFCEEAATFVAPPARCAAIG
jgi:hypothetical protein